MLKKGSIPYKIHQILLQNPHALLTSSEIYDTFSFRFGPITRYSFNIALSRLFSYGHLVRTETQTSAGYIYTLKNSQGLKEKYLEYLCPYSFENKDEIINLMLKQKFETLNVTSSLDSRLIEGSAFISKYGVDYFSKKPTIAFLASLVAFIMGDGHIRKNMAGLQFYFKHKTDAENFKRDFLSIFSMEAVAVIKRKFSYECIISSKELAELLELSGAPVGNKVFQQFSVPEWILHGPDYTKLSFLKIIYGNEGSKPQDNRWRIQLTLSKSKEHVENLLVFMNQIRTMLNHIGISSSFIQLRKQKGRQFVARFYIKGRANLHKFYKLLEFSYASEKQKVLGSLILTGNSIECNTR